MARSQVLLPEGPTTYSTMDLQNGSHLAEKVVTSYGLSPAGPLFLALLHQN